MASWIWPTGLSLRTHDLDRESSNYGPQAGSGPPCPFIWATPQILDSPRLHPHLRPPPPALPCALGQRLAHTEIVLDSLKKNNLRVSKPLPCSVRPLLPRRTHLPLPHLALLCVHAHVPHSRPLTSLLQESEIQLLQDAKRFTAVIEQQQQELEKAEQFPEGSTSELSKLRQQYLRYINEYNAIQDREFEIQYKLNSLLEDKNLLEKEYHRIPKASEAEKKMKALRESCEEIRRETTHRRQEIRALKEDLSSRQKHLTKDQKELDELFRKQEEIKDELVRLQAIPIQLGKDMEKLNRRIQYVFSCSLFDKKLEAKSEELMEEKEDVMKEVDGKKALLESKEREFITFTKMHEMNKENEGSGIAERCLVTLVLHLLSMGKVQDEQ
uniref:Uncharacterized protein n=1 Tax=Varanus komodoensis TaxID=61221 RepID=A0A8D2LW36_VARKO